MKQIKICTLVSLLIALIQCEFKPNTGKAKLRAKANFSDTIHGTAMLDSIQLSLGEAGILENVLAVTGLRVKKGEQLAIVNVSQLKSELSAKTLELKNKQTKLKYIKNKLIRYRKLNNKKLVNLQEVEKLEFELNSIQSEIKVDKVHISKLTARINSSVLNAPSSGIILKVNKSAGEFNQPQIPIIEFLPEDKKYAVFEVPEYLWGKFKIGDQIKIRSLNSNGSGIFKVDRILPEIKENKFKVLGDIKEFNIEIPTGTKLYFEYVSNSM